MKRIIGVSVILASVAGTSCVDARFMRVGLEPLSSVGIPAFQEADDSVRLYASEWKHQLLGNAEPAIPGSSEASDRYEWSSNNPKVAEVRPTGWMITHAPGQAIITVRGPGSSYSQSVAVCSRDASLRIEPHDPVMRLHDTITVSVAVLQPAGGECGKIDIGQFTPQGTQALEPIFSLPNRWRAVRTGTYWYTSSLHLARHTLRDSILVTIQ